jgi:hypothetical protein
VAIDDMIEFDSIPGILPAALRAHFARPKPG